MNWIKQSKKTNTKTKNLQKNETQKGINLEKNKTHKRNQKTTHTKAR